ncbi:hypothetical protein DB42_AK00700 [Neochlamydia sp. EPS4]|nr:hypothetical protein [Neochlamydia sp. EPS4]KIC75270.1 hypothetical protein DB42_AK00700 [Neochlamydia sp. EPS4]
MMLQNLFKAREKMIKVGSSTRSLKEDFFSRQLAYQRAGLTSTPPGDE